MYFIIVGGAAVARYFVSIAVEEGHRVTVIEKNKSRARTILQQYDVKVLNADISQGDILDEAEAKRADAIIATTEDDSVNLMAMLLGKERDVKHLVAMVQNREHKQMFEKLGVRVLTDPEMIIAKKLYSFVGGDRQDDAK
ncbi:TrkA family potassium uptake protein [Myxosarcina sp. GI1]|uniref:potassium channel family protein n=1 Tax=Myxosarcina sp. GI1 TaxID=1541065 RepID=UPI00056C4D54|nr:NAD-binding protein [Myxosarcina sp. GI1]